MTSKHRVSANITGQWSSRNLTPLFYLHTAFTLVAETEYMKS